MAGEALLTLTFFCFIWVGILVCSLVTVFCGAIARVHKGLCDSNDTSTVIFVECIVVLIIAILMVIATKL